jgi:hypothetical protein
MSAAYGIIIVLAIICIAAGYLIYRDRGSAEKSTFAPIPLNSAQGPAIPAAPTDPTGAAGTVYWPPYSTQSKVSLVRGAESPEIASEFSSITGVGKGALVRALSDRYRHEEALDRMATFERQPGQPGSMEEVNDGAMSLITSICRRPRSATAHPSRCLVDGADVDSDFLTDGPYGAAVLGDTISDLPTLPPYLCPIKRTLTSNRPGYPCNELTGINCGLGSTVQDPRYDPGSRYSANGAGHAPGGFAGGPTMTALNSSQIRANANMELNWVSGDGTVPPAKMVTGLEYL